MSEGKNSKNEPKSHMNAYAFFVQTCRAQQEEAYSKTSSVVYSKFLNNCEERWKNMLQEEKNTFCQMAIKNKESHGSEDQNYTISEDNLLNKSEQYSLPKRALSAFYWFCGDECKKVKMQHPEYEIADIAVVLGKKWITARSDVKSKYEAIAHKDKARYKKEVMAYKAKNPNSFV